MAKYLVRVEVDTKESPEMLGYVLNTIFSAHALPCRVLEIRIEKQKGDGK